MERYTKRDADGRYYIESVNGKLESDIKGHTYGEAVDRFAELESSYIVEVVRCKDCTHGSKNEDGSISCNCFMADSMPPTGFCSFGERKVTLRMIKNPDTEAYETATAAVKANDGYCPCLIYKTPDTKCPCKDFREQEVEGECHCGRYVKITE